MANELGRLAQGIRDTKGTNCMKHIQQNQVPKGRKVTHARLVVDHRPGKSDPNGTRLTVGGNLLSFEGDLCTETTDSMSIKMSLNSALSTKGAKFMTVDTKNFCLGTPMDVHEHVKIKCDLMPQEMKNEHDLQEKVTNDGWVCVEMKKGMCGLKQAGVLANDNLEKLPKQDGHVKTKFTPGSWKHKTRPVMFNSCVDDFGAQCVGREHAEHLIATLKKYYEDVTIDWEGEILWNEPGMELQQKNM